MKLTKKELRQFLLTHSREQLVEWLLGVSRDSSDFRQRLDFYTGTHLSVEAASSAIGESIDQFHALFSQGRSLKVIEIVKPAQFLLESLRACLDFGPSTEVPGFIGKMMVSLDQLVGQQPKPAIRLEELQREFSSLHLRAAKSFPPDPATLAETLFQFRSNATANIAPEAPGAYAELLGQVGLARYRELLEPTYQIVVHNHQVDRRSRKELKLFINRRVMLYEWATISEDVEEQVAILLAVARQPDEVLIIAGFLDARLRPMDALQTVQKAFEKAHSPKLATFLAHRYEAQGQFAEALPYRWYLFENGPTKDSFSALMHAAGQTRQTSFYRDRAMALTAEKAKTLHVELLLREDRLGEALSHARKNGAAISSWAKLAELHAIKDPRLAIELYFDCVEFALNERKEGYSAKPDGYVSDAWHLAIDTATFQAFNARLRALFAKKKLPETFTAKLVEAGIPVAKLLQ